MDGFSKDGADTIALCVMTFWHERGVDTVRAWSYRLTDGSADWGVRSNLVGGLPPSTGRIALKQRRMEFLG